MKIKRKTFVGGLLATLCACATVITGLSFAGSAGTAYADSSANGSASVLSIDSSTGTVNTNFENKIQGGQKEYVYFGSDFTLATTGGGFASSGTPMKWRVLTKNDDKYGSDKNLLLQTDSVYNIQYNPNPTSDTVFWGTSGARAMLNGTQTTNGDPIKYFYSLDGRLYSWSFKSVADLITISDTTDFSHAIQGTKPYITRLIYWNNTTNPTSAIVQPTGLSFDYSFTNTDATVTRSMDADVTGGNSRVVGDKVSGDRMFFLDVEDYCNTPSYGFIDSTSFNTYYDAIAARGTYAFTGWQDGYLNYVTSNGLMTDAMKLTANQCVRLRDPVYLHNITSPYANYTVMAVYGSFSDGYYSMGNMLGTQRQDLIDNNYARPATVLDLSQVAYASSYGSNISNTLTDVTGTSTAKPEYKLYIKDSNFSNTGFAPVITSANNKVKVTFKNNSGKAGNIVLLLQDRNATDGSVAYQAVSTMSGGTSEQVVEFNLSSVAYKDYIPTVMLTSANTATAAMATESVYATYTQNGVIIPQDISGMEYNSTHSHWLDNLNLKAVGGVTPKDPVWIDKSMHLDPTVVTVKEIKYKSFVDGSTDEDKTSDGTSKIINAGVYTITLELADKTKYQWADGTTTDKPFKITVDRVKPNVTIGYVKTPPAKRYVTDNGGKLPDIQNVHANATPGTLEWHENQTPNTSDKYYYWKFEPNAANQVNYLTLKEKNDDTKVELNYNVAAVDKLEITINKVKDNAGNDTANDESIYDAFTLTDGDYSLKNYITVKAVYKDNDGTKKDVADSDYSLLILSGGSGGKLAAGTVKIQATGNSNNSSITNKSGTLDNITVLASQVVDITAVYNDNGTHLVYPVTKDDIRGNLTVTAQWNYSGSDYLPVAAKDVDITGDLEAGDPITLTVEYKTKTFDIYPTIEKGTLDMSEVSLTTSTVGVTGSNGAYTFTYDPAVTVAFATSGDVKNANGDTVSATPTITYKKKNSSNAWVAATAADLKNVGEYQIIATYAPTDTANYQIASGEDVITATLTVIKANYEMPSGYPLKKQATYTGSAISLPANWIADLPTGVTVTYYEADGTTPFADKTAVGNYPVKAVFTVADPANYNVPAAVTLTFEITDKKIYNDSGLAFEVTGAEGSGSVYTSTYDPENVVTVVLNGNVIDEEGTAVTPAVTYTYEKEVGGTWTTVTAADLTGAGNYRITAKITTGNTEYADIADRTLNLTIEKAKFDIENYVTFTDKKVAYDGNSHTLEITELGDGKPSWITSVTYKVVGESATTFSAVGTYEFVATFTHGNDNYEDIDDMKATLTITTAALTLEDISFDDDTVTYDGQTHNIEITGDLPSWVTAVTYYVGEEEFTGAVNAGTYEVVAKFTVDESLYNKPEDMTATLTIEKAAYPITGVTFEDASHIYDGEAHSIYVIGAELPDWITIVYTGNEVSEVGTHTVTAKFEHSNGNYLPIADMTAKIVISRAKVALPVFKGGLSYTGDVIKPTAENFSGFDSAIMKFVDSKTVAGLNAGTYKAVFALLDTDGYEWATATTMKKALFAVELYDEMILDANEAAVDWNVARAKITATKANGKLPVFASESYTGSFAEVVGLKYYTDDTLAEEIPAEELNYSTKYFVKAELLDTANFELDETAMTFAKTAFEYTTPEKQLTTWEKIVVFLKANWLWLVIAAVVLIALILLIVLGARSAKRKRERKELEEQRRLEREERKEEERRQREEERRREEREERMAARMAQPQMMPMPQMMQQMPQAQGAPQAQTSAGGGGGSISPELLAIITGMNGKIEKLQSDIAANELASTREELAQTRNELMVERMRGNGTNGDATISGLTAATLAEIVTAAMEKVLSAREKPAQQPAATESAAATQVPPDAVMTTVTTTKIDTTKKQPQTAQAAAPVRTVVRNVVAPMPVDDGRVFDVGGFYKPADPVTDMGFTDEEPKD